MGKILVSVCSGCAACVDCDESLKAEIRLIREEYKGRVIIADVDCLDACDDPPAVAVNGKVIAPASAEKLRTAIDAELSDLSRRHF